MDFDGYLQDLRRSEFYRGQIAHVERIPGQSARYGELKRALHPELERALRSQGIRQFYSHQAEAINAALEGQHVTIVTSTASGKTLCYNVPVIQTVLEQPRARAFYLFPTKALAQDQLGKLNTLGLFPQCVLPLTTGIPLPTSAERFVVPPTLCSPTPICCMSASFPDIRSGRAFLRTCAT